MLLDIKKIYRIMLEKGLNQKEVAETGKIATETLSRVLTGKSSKPNIKTVNSIAKGLGVEPIEIVKEGK